MCMLEHTLQDAADDNDTRESLVGRPVKHIIKEDSFLLLVGFKGLFRGRQSGHGLSWLVDGCHGQWHDWLKGDHTSSVLIKLGHPVAMLACESMVKAPQNTRLRSSSSVQSVGGGRAVGKSPGPPSRRSSPIMCTRRTVLAQLTDALVNSIFLAS